MPGPMPDVPNVLQITIKGFYGLSQWNNVFHWKYGGSAPNNASCDTIAQDFKAAWDTNVTNLTSTANQSQECDVIDLTSRTSGTGTYGATVTGGHTASLTPGSMAMLAKWIVPIRYRGGHPRTYIAGLTQDRMNDEKFWASSATAAFESGFNAFVTAADAISVAGCNLLTPVLVQVVRSASPPVLKDVTAISFNLMAERICSQRRRLGKIGA